MKATFAQLSITEGRHKVLKAIKNNKIVTIQAEIILENDCPDNLEHDEDCVFDFITGKIRKVKLISIK